MVRGDARCDAIAAAGLAVLIWLTPGSGQAQVPGERPALGEGASTMDAPLPGRAVTPGQDAFLYPPVTVPGEGAIMVPRPLAPLPSPAPIRPLGRTPRAAASSPAGAADPSFAGDSTSPREIGRVLQPWVERPGRGFSYAIVASPEGRTYHWIWWPSLEEYYYLFDRPGARYLGAYDRVAGVYRPFDAASRRWGRATALPVPMPAGQPAALESRGRSVGPGRSQANRQN